MATGGLEPGQGRAQAGVDPLTAVEEQGEVLSEEELWGTALLVLIAGFETTVNLIGNGTWALLEHPDQAELLRQ